MYAHYHAEDYASTLEWTSRIIAHPEASMNRVAEAKNVEGNVYWQRGEREDARSQYQEVFTLHTSDALDREAQAKLATLALDSPDVENKVRQVLIGQVSNRLKMTLLHEVINALPEWGLGYYLIGRQLYFDQEYAASNQYLLKAADLGLPHQKLVVENIRLIGVNAYRLGQYEDAIEQFSRIAADKTQPLGVIHRAEDWIERCEWAIEQLSQSAD
jgi:tetratricopeptide (TPR) repeat protein